MLRICLLFFVAFGFGLPVNAQDIVGRIKFTDGDTLRIAGHTVRLFGIDAPESDQNCQTDSGQVWACGKWATSLARKQFNGKRATCTQRDIDQYGRVVAVCRIQGQDIAALLVQQGAATAYRQYSRDYIDDEKIAALSDLGVWSGAVVDPAAHRKASRTVTSGSQASGNCVIKGNISKNGRIYHVPGQKFYNDTVITRSKGEQWFCTRAEAENAGWRAARN